MILDYSSKSNGIVFLMSNINKGIEDHYKGFSGVGNELIKIYNLKKLLKRKESVKDFHCVVKYPNMWKYFLPSVDTWNVKDSEKIKLKKEIDLLIDLSSYHDLTFYLSEKFSFKKIILQFYLKNKQDYKIKTSSKLYKIIEKTDSNNYHFKKKKHIRYTKNQYINWAKIFGVEYKDENEFPYKNIFKKCLIHVNSSVKKKNLQKTFLKELVNSIDDDIQIFIDYGKYSKNPIKFKKSNVKNLPKMSLIELIKFAIEEKIPLSLGPDTGPNQHLSNIIGNFSISIFNVWDPINWIPPSNRCFYFNGKGKINTKNFNPRKVAKFVNWILKNNSDKGEIIDLLDTDYDKRVYNTDKYKEFSNKYKLEKIDEVGKC